MINYSAVQAVCFDCAKAAGFVPKNKAVGVWMDECGICHGRKPCTNLHHDWKKKRRSEMKEIELKPCPFCGHKEHNAVCNCVVKDLQHLHFVRCWMCGARTNAFEQKQDAIDAWNRRASND